MPAKTVFRDYTQAELDRQYNQRTLVPDISDYLARWKEESEQARETLPCRLDIAYGRAPIERLDLFGEGKTPRPCVIYFHGGGWRLLSKRESAGPALLLVPRDIRFAAVDFANADTASLDDMVEQCRRAFAYILRRAADFGIDPARVYLLGHSSGAHLAATVAATDWRRQPGDIPATARGLVAVSGLYDLEPVRLSSRNDYLGLDRAAVQRNSPIRFAAHFPPQTILAYGDGELDEFKRQSEALASTLKKADGKRVELLVGKDSNHFDMNFEFCRPGRPLCTAMLDMLGASAA